MLKHTSWMGWLAALIALLGFLFYWPLGIIAILLAVFFEHYAVAIIIGIILDLAWGPPPASFHFLFFPLTILALVSMVVRISVKRYVRDQGRGERL